MALSYISYSIASKLIYRISVRAVCFPGPDEQRLLEASMAYAAGNPIMSDAEFDELKLRLKVSSPPAASFHSIYICNMQLIESSRLLYVSATTRKPFFKKEKLKFLFWLVTIVDHCIG